MMFFDMDDVLALWSNPTKHNEHTMRAPRFFATLPSSRLAKHLNELCEQRNDIFVVSACLPTATCKSEKMEWLSKHIPNLSKSNIVLCEVGENKAKCVRAITDTAPHDVHILVDDYSKNIFDWELNSPRHFAIKYVTTRNNKSKKQYKRTARNFNQIMKLVEQLTIS